MRPLWNCVLQPSTLAGSLICRNNKSHPCHLCWGLQYRASKERQWLHKVPYRLQHPPHVEKFSLYVEKDSRTSRCAACHHPRTRHRRCPLEAWNLYLLELDRTELPCAGNEEFPVRECLPIPVPVGRKILRPHPHKQQRRQHSSHPHFRGDFPSLSRFTHCHHHFVSNKDKKTWS